jgi:hypothetical protein
MRTRLCLIAKVVWGGAIAIAVIGIVALPASAQQNPAASLGFVQQLILQRLSFG